LGLWDTIKSVGWLNLKARIEIARWPFAGNIANVQTARHALAIDERRRPFAEYRFARSPGAGVGPDFQELWLAGVHGDVGGQCRDDCRLPDIAFSWMVHEARAAGMDVDETKYTRMVGVGLGEGLPPDRALGVITPNTKWWRLAGGWRPRPIRSDDAMHPSVIDRIEGLRGSLKPYRPVNLPDALVSGDRSRE
jgi:uncharacterized protein (DUF2235 family)